MVTYCPCGFFQCLCLPTAVNVICPFLIHLACLGFDLRPLYTECAILQQWRTFTTSMPALFVYTESNNGGIVPPQYVILHSCRHSGSKRGVACNTTEFVSSVRYNIHMGSAFFFGNDNHSVISPSARRGPPLLVSSICRHFWLLFLVANCC